MLSNLPKAPRLASSRDDLILGRSFGQHKPMFLTIVDYKVINSLVIQNMLCMVDEQLSGQWYLLNTNYVL